MPSRDEELLDYMLAACAAGDLEEMREIYQAISAAQDSGLLEAMLIKSAEYGQPEAVQYCLEQGARISSYVVDEAADVPEIYKILVTVGGLDVNEDHGTAGDILINAIWDQKVGSNSLKINLIY